MADDLLAFLDGRPVRARRANPIERLVRWSSQNKAVASALGLAVSSLLFAAIVGWRGYATSSALYERESIRRSEAEANVKLSLRSFEDIFQKITRRGGVGEDVRKLADFRDRSAPGRNPLAASARGGRLSRGVLGPPRDNAAVLESVLRFYDTFAANNETDSRLQIEAAKARRRAGMLHRRAGRKDQAAACLNRSIQILERLSTHKPIDSEDRMALEDCYSELAETLVASAELLRTDQDDVSTQKALGKLRRADAIVWSLLERRPGHEAYVEKQARVHAELGRSYAAELDFPSAVAHLQSAQTLLEELDDRSSSDKPYQVNRIIVRHDLAKVFFKAKRNEEGQRELDGAIRDLDQVRALPNPSDALTLVVSRIDDELAETLKSQGSNSKAQELSARAALARERLALDAMPEEAPKGP